MRFELIPSASWGRRASGAFGQIRTDTRGFLRPLSLPVGLRRHWCPRRDLNPQNPDSKSGTYADSVTEAKLVLPTGLEPARTFAHEPLMLACIPFQHGSIPQNKTAARLPMLLSYAFSDLMLSDIKSVFGRHRQRTSKQDWEHRQ